MNVAPDVLADQYQRARRLWPVISDVEAEFELPPCLLFAVGSKETNLRQEYAEGQVHRDGHGWGLFGADDRWNTLDLPAFASDPEEQARLAARTLRANFRRLGNWLDAVNAYGPAAGRPAYGADVLERAAHLAGLGQTVVSGWHPRAHSAPANRAGGSYIGVAPKIVLHTVEDRGRYSYNPASYYGNPYWPHCTIDGAGIHQHLPIDVSAFALANSAGGAETNRANAIQCEILWFAGQIEDLPDDIMGHLADWVGWVAEQTGAPLDFAEFHGDGSYGEGAPQRFGAREWLDFTGICGHQHVPENDHWDPGAFPVARLRALLGDATTPGRSKEDQLFSPSPVYTVHIIASHSGLLLTSSGEHHGAGVIQRRADGSLNQRWEVWGHDDGTVGLVNRAGGLALDRPDYNTEAGTLLQVARTEHNAAQRWALDQVKPHLARLWAPGTNRCVDVRMRSAEEGASAQLWYGLTDEDDPRHQHFVFAVTV